MKFDSTACPECDFKSSSRSERESHIRAAGHNGCAECGYFIIIGQFYNHYCDVHGSESWNDHAVAWTDRMARERQAEREKAKKTENDGGEEVKEEGKEVEQDEAKVKTSAL